MNLPRIMGHRGAAGHAPENTLAALRMAAQLGVRWVEFDVHLSADRTPILMHDDTLDRTTDGEGAVDAQTADRLVTLDAGSWFSDSFFDEPVPTLEQAIQLLAALGLGANVEIKPSPGHELETGSVVARLLREQWPSTLPPPILSSFKAEALAAARDVAPQFDRALLVHKLTRAWGQQMRDFGCTALHCAHRRLSASDVEQVRRAGYQLNVFTVNDRSLGDRLFTWGAGTLISDYPDRLL